MAPQAKLQAVAFISPQNHPILVRTFLSKKDRDLKYHYLAHTSLDVFEERSAYLIQFLSSNLPFLFLPLFSFYSVRLWTGDVMLKGT